VLALVNLVAAAGAIIVSRGSLGPWSTRQRTYLAQLEITAGDNYR
jgi:hypothetical protein